MYLEARLKAQTPCTGELLKLFFANINPNNSILIKNGEISLKYFFDTEMPKAILDTIEKHEVIELKYGLNDAQDTEIVIDTSNESLEELITRTLRDLSVPTNFIGYTFLKEAIAIVVKDVTSLKSIIKSVYGEVAKKFNTSVSKVERGIRYAIDVTLQREDYKRNNSKFAAIVFTNNYKLTNSEFIAAISDELRLIIKKKGIVLEESQNAPGNSRTERVSIKAKAPKVSQKSSQEDSVMDRPKSKAEKFDEVKVSAKKKSKKAKQEIKVTTLKDLADKVNSYEEFVNYVLDTLNLEERRILFATYIEAAETVENVKWKLLEAYADNKGVVTSGYYDRIVISNRISQCFANDKLTILEFIKKIIEYKNHVFVNGAEQHNNDAEHTNIDMASSEVEENFEEPLALPESFESEKILEDSEEPVNTENEDISETEESYETTEFSETSGIAEFTEVTESSEGAEKVHKNDVFQNAQDVNEEPINESREDIKEEPINESQEVVNEINATSIVQVNKSQRMRCMPEIPEFERILSNIYKNESVETRVVCILNAMGLSSKPSLLQEKLVTFTLAVMELKNIDLQSIFMETNIRPDYLMEARKELPKLINEYVSKFVPNTKVKLVDFLRSLKHAVTMPVEEDDTI